MVRFRERVAVGVLSPGWWWWWRVSVGSTVRSGSGRDVRSGLGCAMVVCAVAPRRLGAGWGLNTRLVVCAAALRGLGVGWGQDTRSRGVKASLIKRDFSYR